MNNNKKKINDPMELSIFHYIFNEEKYEYDRDVFNNDDIKEVYILCKRYNLKYKKNINDIELEVELRKNDFLNPETIKSLYIDMIFNNRKEYDKHIQNREWFMGEVRDKLNAYIIKKGALEYAEIFRETDPVKKERLFNDYKKPELISFEEEVEEEVEEDIEFPLDIFPSMIKNNIFELNKTENFSIDFMANSVIGIMGPIFGRRYTLQFNNTFMANNIFWVCLVGETGSKKSHPLKMFVEVLKSIDNKEYKHYEAEKIDNKNAAYKQIILSDATIESINQIHDINKKGLLMYNDELSGFFNRFGQYKQAGGGDATKANWLEMFDGKGTTINRVSRDPLRLNNATISIAGTIQQEPLLKIMNGVQDGMFERFLYSKNIIKVEDVPHKDTDISYLRKWEKRMIEVNKLLSYEKQEDNEIILFDIKNHGQMITDFNKELSILSQSDEIVERLKNYLSKIKTYLPRFILLLCLMRHYFSEKPANCLLFNNKPEVEKIDIENAFLLCRYYISTYKAVVKNLNEVSDIELIDTVAKRKGGNNKTRIYALLDQGVKQKDIAKQLNVSAAYITKIKKDR